MAYVATVEVAASIRLKFTERIFGNAEGGGSDCAAEYKFTEPIASNIHASTHEARSR